MRTFGSNEITRDGHVSIERSNLIQSVSESQNTSDDQTTAAAAAAAVSCNKACNHRVKRPARHRTWSRRPPPGPPTCIGRRHRHIAAMSPVATDCCRSSAVASVNSHNIWRNTDPTVYSTTSCIVFYLLCVQLINYFTLSTHSTILFLGLEP